MKFIVFIKENRSLIIATAFLLLFLTLVISFVILDDNHIYDRVIVQMPDGTITEIENVKVRDYLDSSWRIICEDGMVYIVTKENCAIFD